MAVILRGLANSNEGDAQGLSFTTSPWGLILNKFTIDDIFGGENLASFLVG